MCLVYLKVSLVEYKIPGCVFFEKLECVLLIFFLHYSDFLPFRSHSTLLYGYPEMCVLFFNGSNRKNVLVFGGCSHTPRFMVVSFNT